ncbi:MULTISPECIES: Hint domain-containing protein [Rhodobacterales]|uniref:Hint domain-containing protein n=1 Tax=Rhodobacterales TaxID=204455 RepID=UPI0011BFD16D|nr:MULTISPECIES: Hint domain-containing protein [Rhodobacterales]MDO6591292.1 Hint domain-containing protein [Yoonia sp. 1_MG-2023]
MDGQGVKLTTTSLGKGNNMAFISEIHYQNSYASSSGVSEFVEVSLTADEAARAADFDLTTYNLDGTVIDTFNLASITPVIDPVTGLYVYSFDTVTTDPNGGGAGNAEAIALTDSTLTEPISFFDIGGGTTAITATEGLADGATSVNIPASASGTSIQFDNEGNRLDGTLTVGSAVCIGNGAEIETARGPVLIEDLCVDDLVVTRDNGLQPLRWKYSRSLNQSDFATNPAITPICIKSGALGKDLPRTDLHVSPQHQLLIEGQAVDLITDSAACLVKAKHLCGYVENVFQDRACTGIEYFHLLFDRHEIIFANSIPTESFFPGDQALEAMDNGQIEELEALFPGLGQAPQADYITLKQWEATVVAEMLRPPT